MRLSKISFIALIAVLAGAGCSSVPAKPEWAGKNWTERKQMYFSGIAAQCPDMVCARDRAYAHAVSSIAEYAGITVQAQTVVDLSNDWHRLESHYTAVSQEIDVAHIQVEKFEILKEANGFTGYILVRVPSEELEAMKKRVAEKAAQAAARKKQKAALGAFRVQAGAGWKEAAAHLEEILRAQDYQIGKNGQPIYLQAEKENCRTSYFEELQICEVYFSMSWQQKKQVFSGIGYGKDKAQARREAIAKGLESLPADCLENL